jgi:hypothetical protein
MTSTVLFNDINSAYWWHESTARTSEAMTSNDKKSVFNFQTALLYPILRKKHFSIKIKS